MKFMLLIYGDQKAIGARSADEAKADMGAFFAYVEAMGKAGILQSGAPLAPAAQASTVRFARGELTVVDGPFSETKEQLGGYFIIDVPTRDEAVAWAAKCPGATTGSVEVRAVAEPPPR